MTDIPVPAPGTTGDREFVHARLIAAPPERVFQAFADPARLARWWGPDGFTSTFAQCDLRPGGRWRFTMHGPDGKDYPNESMFRAVEPGQRVVIEHLPPGHHFFLVITFTPQGDGTRVGWRQVFDTAGHRDRIAALVVPANEENLDRLAAEVHRTA